LSDIICNTSPFQYLHQVGLLHVLPAIAGTVTVPPAVVREIDDGHACSVDLPNIEKLESKDAIVILDDAVARMAALGAGLRLTDTLGVLLDAKRKGLIAEILPVLNRLHGLRFRLATHTRTAILKLAGEIQATRG